MVEAATALVAIASTNLVITLTPFYRAQLAWPTHDASVRDGYIQRNLLPARRRAFEHQNNGNGQRALCPVIFPTSCLCRFSEQFTASPLALVTQPFTNLASMRRWCP